MAPKLPVNSLRTTFAIIEEIVDRNGAGIAELAETLEKPKSTVYDHVVSLYELQYLTREDGTYRLTSDFLRLGYWNRYNRTLYQAAINELQRLAADTGEYASLTVEEHGRAVIIATEEGEQAIPVHIFDGLKMNLHTAAPGKAILAFLSPDRVDEIIETHGLPKRTTNTITDRERLDTELERIRADNYALDDEERLTGMRSVAAPVIDRSGRVQGSLSVYGPTNRIDDHLFTEELPDKLLRAANIVEVLLNYD
ncbi:IclR family transcriptional regulator [Halomarina ordinaria]|uniref:IclR family transcriptional regulator n=1 Tax=Halomarina ordinaria TaxID=3033939 RepID=A0ABD5UG74_9EURY|nr:IclR family transcriptional regulator [Halomarina sp. PSRA2]